MNRVSKFTKLSALGLFLIGMSSCGESFTGRFQGDGSFIPNNCGSAIQRVSNAKLMVRLTISGGDAEIVVLSVTDKATGAQVSGLALSGLQRKVSLADDTVLEGSEANDAPSELEAERLYPIGHIVSGNVAADRSIIDDLNLTIKTVGVNFPSEDNPCTMQIQGQQLDFVD